MVTAELWKRKDIDSLEARLYRKMMFLSNSISNKAILNTMKSIRLAGEAIESLVKHTREDAERQRRITSFYDGKERIKDEGSHEGKPEGKPKGSPRGNLRGIIGKNLSKNYMSPVSWQKLCLPPQQIAPLFTLV